MADPKQIFGTWHRWFAWHPVRVPHRIEFAWLRFIDRRLCEYPPIKWWKYRLPTQGAAEEESDAKPRSLTSYIFDAHEWPCWFPWEVSRDDHKVVRRQVGDKIVIILPEEVITIRIVDVKPGFYKGVKSTQRVRSDGRVNGTEEKIIEPFSIYARTIKDWPCWIPKSAVWIDGKVIRLEKGSSVAINSKSGDFDYVFRVTDTAGDYYEMTKTAMNFAKRDV